MCSCFKASRHSDSADLGPASAQVEKRIGVSARHLECYTPKTTNYALNPKTLGPEPQKP